MGRAKRKQIPPTVAARPVDREAPLDDTAVEALVAVYGDGDGEAKPIIGLGNAVVGGIVVWAIIGVIVALLV